MFLLKHQKSIIFFILMFLVSCFFLSSTADAAGIVPCGRNSGTVEEMQPCTLCHLFVGIDRIIDWGFKILTFVAIASLVAAGIIYIVSAGNEKLMETAKNFAKHTLMGFAIVLGAWLIVNYTMILLSKKPKLGIGVEHWNKFECETKSNLGEIGPVVPSSQWLCVTAGTCRKDPNGSYDSEEKCVNSSTCKDNCGDYHASCTSRPCCNSEYKCVQRPGLYADKKWCVGEGEYCGTGNMGFCYDGTWNNLCPDKAFHIIGGEDCPSGMYCCAYENT